MLGGAARKMHGVKRIRERKNYYTKTSTIVE
jgi:hypothetical protein